MTINRVVIVAAALALAAAGCGQLSGVHEDAVQRLAANPAADSAVIAAQQASHAVSVEHDGEQGPGDAAVRGTAATLARVSSATSGRQGTKQETGKKGGGKPATQASPSPSVQATPTVEEPGTSTTPSPTKSQLSRFTQRVEPTIQSYAQKNAGVLPAGFPFTICPVQGQYSYSDDFGDPRCLSGSPSCGGVHTHQGNDLFAQLGTPIVAPFDGWVEDATNLVGGLSVRVRGSQGYVYNAHLVYIRPETVGQYVKAGTVVGWVGNTGDAQGTSPHDHFEWHPNNGSAISPFPYLYVVCPPGP